MSGKRSIAALMGILVSGIAVAVGGGSVTAGAATAAACNLPQGSERVRLDPGAFTTRIDNPWWPMRPGSRWIYRETDPEGTKHKVVVTVTPRRRRSRTASRPESSTTLSRRRVRRSHR